MKRAHAVGAEPSSNRPVAIDSDSFSMLVTRLICDRVENYFVI